MTVAIRPERPEDEWAISAVVEGVPAYYPRFGFRSATAPGLERADERIPDEAWPALPLRSYDPALRGRVVYPDVFPGPPGA